jgi:hypothetical protein
MDNSFMGVSYIKYATAVPIQCNIQLNQLDRKKGHKNSVNLKFITTEGIQVSLGNSTQGNLASWSTVKETLATSYPS